MDNGLLDAFEQELRRVVPDFQVKFKDESRLQKILGALLYPINPMYMTGFITTFGSTIYFPSRASFLENLDGTFSTIAHEFVHISDSKKDPLFKLKYLFPQILIVVPLIVYGILAGSHAWLLLLPVLGYVVGALLRRKSSALFIASVTASILLTGVLGWLYTGWKLLALLGLLVVAPWPAPWRREYELRGYGMNVAILQWRAGEVPKSVVDFCVREFTGPDYFFMCRDKAYLERTFEATRQQAQQGALQKDLPYGVVYDFLSANRLTFRAA